MDTKHIEEVIEIIRQIKISCIDGCRVPKEYSEALEFSRNFLQDYLKLSGSEIVPKEKQGITYHSGRQKSELSSYSPIDNQKIGFNQCRHELIMRMIGIEEKIFSFLRTYKELECIDECYLERLAHAITTLLTRKEKIG